MWTHIHAHHTYIYMKRGKGKKHNVNRNVLEIPGKSLTSILKNVIFCFFFLEYKCSHEKFCSFLTQAYENEDQHTKFDSVKISNLQFLWHVQGADRPIPATAHLYNSVLLFLILMYSHSYTKEFAYFKNGSYWLLVFFRNRLYISLTWFENWHAYLY